MSRFNSTLRGISLCSLIIVALPLRAEDDWTRHFRIGGSFLLNVDTEFKTHGTFQVNRPPPSAAGGISYDDGFVGVDKTGNAGGVTTFWGYNSASQVDTAADRLTFHGTDSFDTTGNEKVSDIPVGFDMVYAGTIREWNRVSIGGELGFGFNLFDSRDRSPLAAMLNRSTGQYDIGGTALPPAPYRGTEDATPPSQGGTAPVISSDPVSQGSETVPGTISGSRSLEGVLYHLRLGPLVRWEFYPRWTLNGSAGGVLGIFDADYHFNETITTATSSLNNKGKFGTLDMKPGGYAGAVVMYDSGSEWEVYLGGHFLTLGDEKVSSGGREATMHLGAAIYISAGINWSF
jgi:hypothetical protein